MKTLSHLNEKSEPILVDVSNKATTKRSATAQSTVSLSAEAFEKLHGNGFQSKKGAVFQTAIIAGILAAKKTGELIPLCHPLFLENCEVHIGFNSSNHIIVSCTATTTGKTGVEMEALTGASVAALTIYDMCKSLTHDIVISETKLLAKTGGKHDFVNT